MSWVFKCALILFFIFSAERGMAGDDGRLINKIVAVVGEEVLTLYELEELAEPYYQAYLARNVSISKEEKERLKQKIKKEILDQWIEDTLIGLEARKFGIRVTDEELEEFLRQEARGQNVSPNLSKEEREKLRDRLTKIKFIQILVRDRIAIPEEELKRAYQEKIRNYRGITKYHLEVLLLKREAPVEEIYSALLKGKNFEEVVRERPAIGFYVREVFHEEELDREVLERIRQLKEGELSAPIHRGENVQIIRVLKKETSTPPSFEEVRKDLYEELFNRRAQEYLERWIKELRETRFIRVYL